MHSLDTVRPRFGSQAYLLAAITLGPGYIVIIGMVAARDDKRGYHDLWASTVVVHG